MSDILKDVVGRIDSAPKPEAQPATTTPTPATPGQAKRVHQTTPEWDEWAKKNRMRPQP